MKKPLPYRSIRTTKGYDDLVKASYLKVKQQVEEIELPAVKVIAVDGNEPPDSWQFQDAVAVLYGIAYTLKMGLKFGKLPRPKGYFDFNVGALATFWWSTGKTLDVHDPKTLRWQAYLMVPSFVSRSLVNEARRAAKAKHPEIPFELASLETLNEGRAVQTLHVGPYDRETPTIERLHRYMSEHGLSMAGRHHEIYISDPRRTRSEKLKTVIRFAVKADGRRKRADVQASARRARA